MSDRTELERDVAAFAAEVGAVWNEMGAINQRNGFCPLADRSPEDRARFRELDAARERLEMAFDAKYPPPACLLCGGPTMPLWFAAKLRCANIAGCPNAPKCAGG